MRRQLCPLTLNLTVSHSHILSLLLSPLSPLSPLSSRYPSPKHPPADTPLTSGRESESGSHSCHGSPTVAGRSHTLFACPSNDPLPRHSPPRPLLAHLGTEIAGKKIRNSSPPYSRCCPLSSSFPLRVPHFPPFSRLSLFLPVAPVSRLPPDPPDPPLASSHHAALPASSSFSFPRIGSTPFQSDQGWGCMCVPSMHACAWLVTVWSATRH